MKVLVIAKQSFSVTQLSGVSNIAYDSGTHTYTITHSGGTATYAAEDYRVSIIW